MEVNQRALYNSLRMNWLLDGNTHVQPWQVEDYRSLKPEQLFERLKLHEIDLERQDFHRFSDQFDTPEEMTEGVLAQRDVDSQTKDQIYLLIFELWRRLVPEKPCLSIFCDELDYQIHLHDKGGDDDGEGLQDILANLQIVLDENTDAGASAAEAFETISSACAHDIESFLYDYIAELIDNDNVAYASELLDDFSDYVEDAKWFEFLRARLQADADAEVASEAVAMLMKEALKSKDLDFNFELLSYMVQNGQKADFVKVVKSSVPLLETEEDFHDLLAVCIDFFQRLDMEVAEGNVQEILKNRMRNSLEKTMDVEDPDVAALFEAIK